MGCNKRSGHKKKSKITVDDTLPICSTNQPTHFPQKENDLKTLVTFLLDRTGSMDAIKQATIESFNAYIVELKKADDMDFTLVQFDSVSIEKTCHNVAVKDAPLLSDGNYQPRASTPLIDAAFKTIKAVEEALTKRDDKPQVVICIQTDGEENCSREHSWDELNALIKEKIALGWQFNFMGASIDAYSQGNKMGISAHATVSYDSHDEQASLAAFRSNASNTSAFAAGARVNTSYTMEQRGRAKDAHIPKDLTDDPALTKQPKAENKAKKQQIVDDITL